MNRLKHLGALLCILTFCAGTPSLARELIQLSDKEATSIGQKIWQNEGLGKTENLIVWNKGEEFPSLGIGHFIWYPAGYEGPFTESFPQLLEYLSKTLPPPVWLMKQSDAPWPNRNAFYTEIDSARMNELRGYLEDTIPQQTRFIIKRLNASLPKILATLESDRKRQQIERQFYHVARSSQGVYALIDYVNFKGEGTSPKERYKGKGWGLLQVLDNMATGSDDTMAEFVRAADFVLTRRVNNAPRDESRWLSGWRKRLQTYLAQ